MENLEPKKLALLRILQIFKNYSDYDHPLKQEDIAGHLEREYGIVLERKAISRNISLLKEAGYDVYLISVDLDRQKATQRAYNRFIETKRYVPLSLIFDGYGNQATLNYFKIKQQNREVFLGFAQISTDVPLGEPVELIEEYNIERLKTIDWR